jgi:two-component system, OmpR family, alkaline phosphatase synthesis response regulator PhoP
MKSDRPRILVVEDDEGIMLGLEENLKAAGYDVLTAADGPKALTLAVDAVPDLVILDVMLPGMSGYEVCRELREKGRRTPVIMLTARQDEFDKLHGFEMGADDYVTKPFSIRELMARVKAILQRGKAAEPGARRYEFDDCVVDLESRVCTRKDRDVAMTRTEFDLLAYFCRNEGKALSREHVMQDVWGTQYFGTQRSLDSFVASLRAKIEAKPAQPKHILTVRGVGYKFAM